MRIGKWILVGLLVAVPTTWSGSARAQVLKLPIRNPPAKQLNHQKVFPPKDKNTGVNQLSPSTNGSPAVSNLIGEGSTRGENRDERRAATTPSDVPGSSEQGRVRDPDEAKPKAGAHEPERKR